MKRLDNKRWHDSTKLIFHMKRVIEHYDEGKRIVPIHIDCGITKMCNMRCTFGYCEFQDLSGDFIKRDALINNLVKSAAKIGVKSLGFIGDGEPTLNPAWEEALKVGKYHGLSLAISTNGILVDSDHKRMTILSCCDWMRFNISAYTEEGYKKIHQSGARNKVLDNFRNLVNLKRKTGSKCDIGIQMVFVPDLMMDEVIPLSKYAVEVGADYFVIKQCSLPDSGESGMSQFDVNTYDSEKVVNLLKEAESMSTKYTDIIPKWNIMSLKGQKNYKNCPSIPLIFEISGNGSAYPCGYFFSGNRPDLCFGNVHDNSLEEIINSERYWKIVNHLEHEFEVGVECKGSCRQDACNIFLNEYLNCRPQGINFI